MVKKLIKNQPLVAIVLAFQLFRLVLIPFSGLMPQDAYYYFYGQHLAISYLDHPGMIGYAVRLMTDLFGATPTVIKLTDFIITSFTLIAFYNLAGLFLTKKKQNSAFALLGTSLLVSIISVMTTPDVPLLLFWTLSLIALYKAIFLEKKGQWLWAGLFIGLAFDSKYTAIFLQFGLISFLVLSNKYRKLLWSKGFIGAMILSTLLTFPVFYWNYQHDFVSFIFQVNERAENKKAVGFNPVSTLGTIAHQMFILLPPLFILLAILTFKTIKKQLLKWHFPEGKKLFLLSFFLPTFLGFFAISLFYWVKINWLMPGYISGIIFASIYISRKWIKINVIFAIIFHLLIAIEVVFYPVAIKGDDTWFGWEELSQKVAILHTQYPDAFIFSDDNYKTTSVLNFYLDQKFYGRNIIGLFAHQYDYIGDDLSLLNGKNAIFINSQKRFKNDKKLGELPKKLEPYFDAIKELKPILIKHNGKTVRKFLIYYVTNYKNKPKN